MSEENVEAVRAAFEAWDRDDLEETLKRLGPDFELHTTGRFAGSAAIYRGREGWSEWWQTFRDAWETITISIERIEDLGDQVLLLGTFYAQGRGSGVEVTGNAGWIMAVRDGLIGPTRAFAEWDEALEAAGLSE